MSATSPAPDELFLGELGIDLPSPRPPAEAPTTAGLRHAHHQAARLIALGRPMQEVALITGYSATHLGQLKNHDPAFQDLVEHYTRKADEIFVDVAKRMRELGLSALEELQERMSTKPSEWTRKELMEFIELMFGKGGAAKAAGLELSKPASAPVLNVTFVQPPEVSGPVIEGRALLTHDEG